jgi:hypothetical protein
MEWQKTFGSKGYDRASAVLQTMDGGYALTGELSSEGEPNGDVFVLKTDMFGNTLTESINPVLQSQLAKVFPNPATGYLYLVLDESLLKNQLKVSLYDAEGKQVLSRQVTTNEIILDVASLPRGVYEYRVKGNNSDIRGKVMLQ